MTFVAFVWVFNSMLSLMLIIVFFRRCSKFTFIAVHWRPQMIKFDMHSQIPFYCTSIWTKITGKRLFSSMKPHMAFKIWINFEWWRTQGALKWRITSMRTLHKIQLLNVRAYMIYYTKWTTSWLELRLAYEQTWHLYGRSSVWILMCFVRLLLSAEE